jgi:hypothetical protein
VPAPISNSYGSETRATWQEQAPILCRCAAFRRGRLADHRAHVAEYARLRAAGCLFDDVYFAALSIEPMLDRDEATA